LSALYGRILRPDLQLARDRALGCSTPQCASKILAKSSTQAPSRVYCFELRFDGSTPEYGLSGHVRAAAVAHRAMLEAGSNFSRRV